jgi:hypothetical protein
VNGGVILAQTFVKNIVATYIVALVIGVCTPAIMAQETSKAGIYGGIQNLRFKAPATSKQDAKQESVNTPIYGALQNPRFNALETSCLH